MAQPVGSPTRNLLLLVSLLLPLTTAQAGEILLYDQTQGDKPQDQPWMAYFFDFLTGSDPGTSASTTGVSMDSTPDLGDSAGFFNHGVSITLFPPSYSWSLVNSDFPALSPAEGFSLSFELTLRDEDHANNNRAGFSVILLGMDLFGIELGFWEDEIWAQGGPGFTKAESADFDTVDWITYELLILNSEYILFADGLEILSGDTRNYSPANPFPDPYDTPNMVFLGDNTGSAGADFTLGSIVLNTTPFAAPAPASTLLILAGLAWFGRRRPRH